MTFFGLRKKEKKSYTQNDDMLARMAGVDANAAAAAVTPHSISFFITKMAVY